MNPYIKAFLDDISDGEDSSTIQPPKVYTRENINDRCMHSAPPGHSLTILELAVCFKHNHYIAIQAMFELGAEITDTCVIHCLPIYYHLLLEYGGLNPNRQIRGKIPFLSRALIQFATLDEMYCIVDYGGKPPEGWKNVTNAPIIDQVKAYASLSNSRIVSSRKALAALIICCKRGFYPLRDVGVALAREMWGARGPADKCCGPRSKEWFS